MENNMPESKDSTGNNSGDVPAATEITINDKETSPVSPPAGRWIRTSPSLLEQAEERVLKGLKTPYNGRFVNIGPVVGTEDNQIWTVSLNEDSKELPLVLVHGYAAGIGFWALNLDAFAQNRPVYACDLLGFGRSSRVTFDTDPAKIEKQFIDAIEAWRASLKLEKFVLLGHSFGGYLSMSYSITYPNSVAHLILADPWGFPEVSGLSWYINAASHVFRSVHPLYFAVRVFGPIGPGLLKLIRWDLIRKFAELNKNGVNFGDYIYQCNAQEPSGEKGFHNVMDKFKWSKLPMIRRVPSLPSNIDITVMYGAKSWVPVIPPEEFPKLRPDSKVEVHILKGADHHVYADAKDEFNEIVNQVCSIALNGS